MMHALLWLLLACGSPTPLAELPGDFASVPIPAADLTVAESNGGLDLQVAGALAADAWLGTVDEELGKVGWELNQAMKIPGGHVVEYLRDGQTLRLIAGGKPGALKVRVEFK
jgi:hypothetical protein